MGDCRTCPSKFECKGKVEIDYKKCKFCGKCISVCEEEVFKKENSKIIVAYPEKCAYCYLCQSVCPSNAINFNVLQ